MDNLAPFELTLEPDIELAEAETQPFNTDLIRKCKIVTTIPQARYGHFRQKPACLFVFNANFIPYYDVRFKYVEIELRIVKPKPPPADPTPPTFVAYQPKTWQGRREARTVQHNQQLGANAGVATQAAIGVNAGPEASVGRSVEFTEMKRAWLESNLEPSTIKWRLCENDNSREGVPKPFQGAVIIAGGDGISVRISYSVKLSRSADPMSWAPGHVRTVKPLLLDRASVGDGIGVGVDGIEEMEKDEFRLESLVVESWDL